VSIPKVCYSLTVDAKKVLLEWIRELHLPDGYSTNLSRCVDMRELKMAGMKSHDCHVLIERILPIALKELLPQNRYDKVGVYFVYVSLEFSSPFGFEVCSF
jgi:hypothetical protein